LIKGKFCAAQVADNDLRRNSALYVCNAPSLSPFTAVPLALVPETIMSRQHGLRDAFAAAVSFCPIRENSSRSFRAEGAAFGYIGVSTLDIIAASSST
jgi:hypothetical protein